MENKSEIIKVPQYSLDDVTSIIVSCFEFTKDEFENILNNEIVQTSLDVAKKTMDETGYAITVFKVLRSIASIPNKLYMSKFERYMKGLCDIDPIKREKYLKKVGKKGLNRDSVFVLNLLNKIEELSKIDIFLSLQEAKMDETIEDSMYRRLMIMTDRTLYSDLLYMRDHLTNDNFRLSTEENEGLMSAGWIAYQGQTFGTIGDENKDMRLFAYTDAAKLFCKIVFNTIASDEVTEGPTQISELDNADIERMFQ